VHVVKILPSSAIEIFIFKLSGVVRPFGLLKFIRRSLLSLAASQVLRFLTPSGRNQFLNEPGQAAVVNPHLLRRCRFTQPLSQQKPFELDIERHVSPRYGL
jgi:hypothetical protein